MAVARESLILGASRADTSRLATRTPASTATEPPLLTAETPGAYAARAAGDTLLLFFAPTPRTPIAFPLRYGQADGAVVELETDVHWRGHVTSLDTAGAPGQALLFEIADGRARALDIGYVPPPPHTVADAPPRDQPWRVE